MLNAETRVITPNLATFWATKSIEFEQEVEGGDGDREELKNVPIISNRSSAPTMRFPSVFEPVMERNVSFRIAWPLETLPRRPRISPFKAEIKTEQKAKALLTSEVKRLITPLQAIVRTKSLETGIEIRSIVLSYFRDPEEDHAELVFEVHVAATPSQGLAFWDCLGSAIDRWRSRLTPRLAEILNDRVGIHVVWS
ncbi:MAG: hypothetical protein HYU86_04105 [Chloroflexi bacterium]|nr:hypothetical protein [Chloroflexota bacterium]